MRTLLRNEPGSRKDESLVHTSDTLDGIHRTKRCIRTIRNQRDIS
jgi:hypothetical protein